MNFLKNSALKVLLAIDEASNLIEPRTLDLSCFYTLVRVLSEVPSERGFFTVFANTMPLAPIVVTPPLAKHPELRIPCRGGRLFPLIYRLATLDVMTPPDLQTLQELVSPNRLFSYGNPFYGLYFQDLIEFAPGTAILFIMVEAQAILLCEHFPPPPKLIRPQILVVLGFITQTQVSTTSPLHSELISSHAAHCMYINSAEDYVISHYPSSLSTHQQPTNWLQMMTSI
jgi:hypothetical protein